jgi:hypothetical protein
VLERSSFFSAHPLLSSFVELAPATPLDPTPVHPLMMPELPHFAAPSQPSIGTQAISLVDTGALETTTPPVNGVAPDVQQALQAFFAQPDWQSQLSVNLPWSFRAFQISWLANSVAQGNFSALPPIQVVPADTLGDKSVSFDWLTGTISLSSDFMAQNASNPAATANTILEAMSAQKGYTSGSNRPWMEGNAWFSPIRGWGSNHWRPFNSLVEHDGGSWTGSWGMQPFKFGFGSTSSVFLTPLNQFNPNSTTPLNAAEQMMQSFFSQSNWTSQLPLSLWNQSSLWMMPYKFAMGNFQNFPKLQVMTGNELGGKALNYDASTNSIQVSNWFLEANQNDPSVVVKEVLNLNLHIQHGTLNYYAPPMGSETWTLNTATAEAQAQLVTFVSQPDWIEKVKPALGSSLNAEQANAIAQSLISGNLKIESLVKVVSAATLNGANSVYDPASKLIYLAQEFVDANTGNPDAIAGALVEEFGHYLDTQINTQDSPGDEGKLFAAIVGGTLLSAADWAAIKAVDDSLPPVIDVYKPLLDPAYSNAQTTLNALFAKPDWIDQLIPALGTSVNRDKAMAIAQSFLNGQLTLQSLVKVLPAQSMGGLDSVFDTTTNTIYLSQEFINRNAVQPEVMTQVLLEAFGHYLDSQLNSADSQGDEGQMFAAIAQGSLLSAADWYAMKAEEDRRTIVLDGQDRLVEVAA